MDLVPLLSVLWAHEKPMANVTMEIVMKLSRPLAQKGIDCQVVNLPFACL
jgi:hypothetical protein